MKKTLIILLAALMVCGVAFAGTSGAPAYRNVKYFEGPNTYSPPMEVRLVRYSREDKHYGNALAGVESGDVCLFDCNSADGMSIITADILTGICSYAGIAVTDIATSDSNNVDATNQGWGYIAIRGYCLGRIDQSAVSHAGMSIAPAGSGLQSGIAGAGETYTVSIMTPDIGVILHVPAADGLDKIWLR